MFPSSILEIRQCNSKVSMMEGWSTLEIQSITHPADLQLLRLSLTILGICKSQFFGQNIEYEIVGEGSQISTNQKRENSA